MPFEWVGREMGVSDRVVIVEGERAVWGVNVRRPIVTNGISAWWAATRSSQMTFGSTCHLRTYCIGWDTSCLSTVDRERRCEDEWPFNGRSYNSSHLIWSNLNWPHSDLVCCGCDKSEKTARSTSFRLVATTANWVALQRTRFRWNQVRWDKVRWGQMKRDNMSWVIWTSLYCQSNAQRAPARISAEGREGCWPKPVRSSSSSW